MKNGKSLWKKLLETKIEMLIYRKKAKTFTEEAALNHIIYALTKAIEVLGEEGKTNGNG